MKPPFSYYGGKQRMASKIVPLIPKHTVYVEPFCGSATILFAKPWPHVTNVSHYREVINDTNKNVVNFFRQLRDNGDELAKLCTLTPYSKTEHEISKNFQCDDSLELARRFFVNINQAFNSKMNSTWNTTVTTKNHPATWMKKNSRLLQAAERISQVYIENDDALAIIQNWDSPQTLFYCDPPYPNCDQGHYRGYTQNDFDELITALNQCQGSFLLSCYGFDAPNHWEKFTFDAYCSCDGQGTTGSNRDKTKAATNLGNRKRTEVVYRVIRGENVRPEIQKLYDSGKFDCFQGKKTVSAPPKQGSLFDLIGDLDD